MRVVWTIASIVLSWVSINADVIAAYAVTNTPANLVTAGEQQQYVTTAWIGAIFLTALTVGSIVMTIRAYKKH